MARVCHFEPRESAADGLRRGIRFVLSDRSYKQIPRPPRRTRDDSQRHFFSNPLEAFCATFMKKIVLAILSLQLIAIATVHAQAPAGAIAGVVTDPTGAAIPGAHVVVANKETGLKRALVTGAEGDYSAPALLAGVY